MSPTLLGFMKRKASQRSTSDSSTVSTSAQSMAPGVLQNEDLSPASGIQADLPSGSRLPSFSDVMVVGAGPAGLMLACNLVRFGIKVDVVDNRPDKTATGRADGLQPKTIETLKQMRLAEPVMRKGVKVYDICFWRSAPGETLHRTGREVHYPPVVDCLDPYILLVHQGMIEGLFIDDLAERGVQVKRNTSFVDFSYTPEKAGELEVTCKVNVDHARATYYTHYLVGCDGAHSRVRKCIPGSLPLGASHDAIWGVIDGELDTDFPDVWSKTVVYSETSGSVLIIPRERNLTRLYIELKPDSREGTPQEELSQQFVMQRARDIMEPYRVKWRSVEWFGRYRIGQRVATKFTDEINRVFICGDASHTHSPKAAQGMNTSMHDSWNLAWKLNFAIRGLAKPSLLASYEDERKKIAQDLISFDYEHANAFAAGDSAALAENFKTNVRFISGVGAEYGYNTLNVPPKTFLGGDLRVGCLLPPAKATRYIDANPIDIQIDIPMLGQFRIFFFAHNVHAAKPFLEAISNAHVSRSSLVGRLTHATNASYMLKPPVAAPHDGFIRPERYTPVSGLATYALVTDMEKAGVEIADLPTLLRQSPWTFYMDDISEQATRKQSVMQKWFGGLAREEVVVVLVRPDGYCGTVRRFPVGSKECGADAVVWMDEYFGGFLQE